MATKYRDVLNAFVQGSAADYARAYKKLGPPEQAFVTTTTFITRASTTKPGIKQNTIATGAPSPKNGDMYNFYSLYESRMDWKDAT